MNDFYNKLYSITDKRTIKINNFLFSNKNFYQRIIGFLKTPYYLYFLILEIILKKHIDKNIFESLLNDNDIIESLDKNEFAYKNFKLIKKDIVPDDNNSPLQHLNDLQLKNEIRNEFEGYILEIIRTSNIVFNIENFLKVMVDIENDINSNKIYTVIICYYKNPFIDKLRKFVITNSIILLTVITMIISILLYYFGIINK